MNLLLQVLGMRSEATDVVYLGFAMYIGRFEIKCFTLSRNLKIIHGRTMLIYTRERNP
jgi:hypothetical protein